MDTNFVVLVDNKDHTVFYSENFISVELGYEELAEKDSIKIQIIDSNSIKSDTVQMDVLHVTRDN